MSNSVFIKQFSFNTGLVSPRLLGNTNVNKYQNALAESNNWICGPYGYLTCRSGTKYIAGAYSNSSKSFLFPFKYSNQQSYILECTNGIVRFFKDSGEILQSRGFTNGTFTSDLTGWTTRNAGTGSVAQSTGKASFTSSGAGNEARIYQTIVRLGTSQYTVTCDVATNSLTYRVGITSGGSTLGTGTLTAGTGKTFTFTNTTNSTVYIEFEAVAAATLDNVVLSSPVYQIPSPYVNDDSEDLILAQSFDTVYITNRIYAPQKLIRYGHDNWELDQVSFTDGPYLDVNSTTTTITPSGTTGSITLTASSGIFASTDVNRLVRWKSGPDNTDAKLYNTPGSSQTSFDIGFFPQDSTTVEVYRYETSGAKTALTYNSGVLTANQFKITAGQVVIYAALSSGQQILVQRKNTGSGQWSWLTITAYTSATQVTATVSGDILGGTNASTYWRLGAWSATTGYPKLCVFHAQRLWFGNTQTQPDGIWASAIQDFENFSPDNALHKDQIDSDTAISAVVSGIIAIQWMKATNILLLGGEGIKSVNKGLSSISASNLTILPEEATLSADIEPIITANEILFAEDQRKSVRSVGFTFQSDAFSTFPVNQLNDSLFEVSQIKKIVYQTAPFPLMWCITDDGGISSCTYDKEQSIYAWNSHSIGGFNVVIDSVAVIPQDESSQLWLSISRTIDNTTVRYIELMSNLFFLDDQDDAAFTDSHLIYDGVSTTTISGLDHLEDEEVTIMSEGGMQNTKIVEAGSILLDSATTKAVIGLSYPMTGKTVPLDTGKPNGAAIGSKTIIEAYIIDVLETYGLKIGYNSDEAKEINFRPAGLVGGEAYPLFTGTKRETVYTNTQDNYQMYFENPYALPCTIRNVTYIVNIATS